MQSYHGYPGIPYTYPYTSVTFPSPPHETILISPHHPTGWSVPHHQLPMIQGLDLSGGAPRGSKQTEQVKMEANTPPNASASGVQHQHPLKSEEEYEEYVRKPQGSPLQYQLQHMHPQHHHQQQQQLLQQQQHQLFQPSQLYDDGRPPQSLMLKAQQQRKPTTKQSSPSPSPLPSPLPARYDSVMDPSQSMSSQSVENDQDDSEMTFAEDHTDEREQEDEDGGGDDQEEDYDDDETYTYGGTKKHSHNSAHAQKHKSRLPNTPQTKVGQGSSSAPGSGGKSAARQRRGRGRALLGLNVVVTNGRYKGETGLVVRGANGYYSCKFHRTIAELRAHDNTAMKRSSELAPITPSGKRLQLPIPPAQRKLMKQQALQTVSAGGLISMPSSATSSPRIRAVQDPSSSTSAHQSGKRKVGVSFSQVEASPRGDRRRRKKLAGGYTNEDDDEDGDEDYSYGGSRRSASPSQSSDRSRSPSRSPGGDSHMYAPSPSGSSGVSEGEEDDESFGAPRLSHSRSHSSSSSRSSSPSRSTSLGSQSPTRTELLSPHITPQYGSASSPQGTWSLTTAMGGSGSSSIPASPHLLNVSGGGGGAHHGGLPNMSLGPRASAEAATAQKAKVASLRVSSPEDAKTAATILLALSHVGATEEGGVLISGGEIPPSSTAGQHPVHKVREESYGLQPHTHAWQTAH